MKVWAYAVLMVLGVYTVGAAQGPDVPVMSPDEIKKVEEGQIIIRRLSPTGGRGVAARAIGIIRAPSTKVWPVLRDCQYFKDFLPRTEESTLKSRNGLMSVCYTKIDMPFPFSDLWADVKSVETPSVNGVFKRRWSLIKGTYKRNNGSWTVVPWGPSKTLSLIIYEIDLDPDTSVPDFIIRKAQTSTLPDVFEAVRKRVSVLP